jgi:Ras family.
MAQSFKENDTFPLVLVMNQTELPESQWKVSRAEANQLAESLECKLMFSSSFFPSFHTNFLNREPTSRDVIDETLSVILEKCRSSGFEAKKKTEKGDEIEVVLIGEELVGKTTFVHRFMDGSFISEYKATNSIYFNT